MGDDVETEVGRVTARIAPGTIGEVRIGYRGGSEVFHAYAWEDDETIEIGTEIVVIERVGPRSVKVTPLAEEGRRR